ncbi:MAG: ABC transporter permease [Anaerolineae bacterium]|nr:ABC transporter permease [Anaerolineae bacterium]
MTRYIGLTTLQYALALGAAIVINFALPRLAPGDPADFLIPPEVSVILTQEQRQELLAQFGLGQPTSVQFQRYVAGIFRGDLLFSLRYGRPVSEILAERLPWTLLLTGSTFILTNLIGVLAGFWSAWRRGTWQDATVLSTVMFVDSMPGFFVGMLLILVFAVQLGWFPVYGTISTFQETGLAYLLAVLKRLAMPVATLTLATLAPVYLVARSALISELSEDYVYMAEAKGLDRRGIRRHVRRNALLPVSSILFLNVGTLIGGATIIETIFSYPGVGFLIFEGVTARDYPLLQGAFLLMSISVIGANFLAEVIYPLLDPRVRQTKANS